MFYLQHLSKHQHAVVNRSKAVVSVAAVHTDRKDKYAVPVLRFSRRFAFVQRGLRVIFSQVKTNHAKSCQVGQSSQVNFM